MNASEQFIAHRYHEHTSIGDLDRKTIRDITADGYLVAFLERAEELEVFPFQRPHFVEEIPVGDAAVMHEHVAQGLEEDQGFLGYVFQCPRARLVRCLDFLLEMILEEFSEYDFASRSDVAEPIEADVA